MRDKNQNIQLYLSSLEKELKKVPRRILDLRNHVAIDPNFTFETILGLPSRKDEVFSLLLFVKWFPPEITSIFQIELEEKIKKFNFQDQKELWLLSSLDCEQTLYFLSNYPKLSDRDFFGNILPKGRQILENLSFSMKRKRKPKFVQRKRGYNDQGSRRLDSKWLPSFDFSLTLEQRFIEIQRDFLFKLYIPNQKKLLSQDILLCKTKEELGNCFPEECKLLGKSFFFSLLFENWNEDSPLHRYLINQIKN